MIRRVCVDLYGSGLGLSSGVEGTRDTNEGTTVRERPKRSSAPVGWMDKAPFLSLLPSAQDESSSLNMCSTITPLHLFAFISHEFELYEFV